MAGCTAQLPLPADAALDLPNDPRIVLRRDPSWTLPADCQVPDLQIDTAAAPPAPISRSEAERRSGGMGDGRAADQAVLGRVTMSRSDIKGNPIQARPAWILYWSGLMHKLPSNGPRPLNPDAAATARPVFYSTR